jgi:hypothetical protein
MAQTLVRFEVADSLQAPTRVLLPLHIACLYQDRQMVEPSVLGIPMQQTLFKHQKDWLHPLLLLNRCAEGYSHGYSNAFVASTSTSAPV